MNKSDIPLVSIITLVYNHGSYLRECLESFVNQKTNFAFEVVIHDDASLDNSKLILEEFEARYPSIIHPIYQSENQFSKGVKVGIKYLYPRAQGKYIALCEGDDYWTDPYKLQKQVDFMEAHSDYSMCFHAAIESFEGYADKNHLFSKIECRDYSAQEIFNRWIVPTASVLFKKDVVDSEFYRNNIAYNPNIIFGDIALFITCSQFGKIKGFSDVMSVYRRHKGGMMQQMVHFHMQLKNCMQGFVMASIFTSDAKLNKLILDKAIKRTLTMYWGTVFGHNKVYRSKSFALLKVNFKKHPFLILLQSPVRFYMALRTLYRNKNRRKI